jgi:hypothetical protein
VGHGYPDGRFRQPPSIASSLAAAGYVSIAIDAVGHGFGPKSTLRVTDKTGSTKEIPAAGRGIDFDGNGILTQGEGCIVAAGPQVVVSRDCLRQTALDLMQLVRIIKSGVDLTGSGRPELDGSRIYYAGHSMGADYGTLLSAVEPAIQASVLNSGGGSTLDLARWGGNPLGVAMLGLRQPSLLNTPGPGYDMAWPLRDMPPQMIATPGAIAIQECAERIEWNMMSGDPLAYAQHLRAVPLANVPPRHIMFQMALGDRSEINPAETNQIRASGMTDVTSLYRHDRAVTGDPTLPLDPHQFGFPVYTASGTQKAIARAAQQQIAAFFAGDGLTVPDVNASVKWIFAHGLFDGPAPPLFEVPSTLPPGFNFVAGPAK